jgi:flagellin
MLSNINITYAVQLNRHAGSAEKAMERISSGIKLNHAWDGPADFALGETTRKQAGAANDVGNLIQDAINVLHIGEDGIQGILDVVNSIRDVLVQAGNDIHTDEQNAIFQQQIDTQKGLLLQAYAAAKNFRVRLDGPSVTDRVLNFQVGTGAGEMMQVDYNPLRDTMRDLIIGIYGYQELYDKPEAQTFLQSIVPVPPAPNTPVPPPPVGPNVPPGTTWAQAFPNKVKVDPWTRANITAAFDQIDRAQSGLISQMAYLGTSTNRLEAHLATMQAFEQNMTEKVSRIRDTDLAVESTTLSKSQVLQQASQSMLAQANARAQDVLELLRN